MITKERIIRTIAALRRRSRAGIYGPFVKCIPTEREIAIACNGDTSYKGLRDLIYVSPCGSLSMIEVRSE